MKLNQHIVKTVGPAGSGRGFVPTTAECGISRSLWQLNERKAFEQKSGDREQWNLYIMNSLAVFMVDLRMAKGRFLRVFDVVDEKCTVRTPNSKMAYVREAGLARCETSLGVRRSMALISGKRLEIQSAARLSSWAAPR
jgi:hypothetical protein